MTEHAWENHHAIHWEETSVLDKARSQGEITYCMLCFYNCFIFLPENHFCRKLFSLRDDDSHVNSTPTSSVRFYRMLMCVHVHVHVMVLSIYHLPCPNYISVNFCHCAVVAHLMNWDVGLLDGRHWVDLSITSRWGPVNTIMVCTPRRDRNNRICYKGWEDCLDIR